MFFGLGNFTVSPVNIRDGLGGKLEKKNIVRV